MELWFSEVQTENVKLNIKLNKHLFSGQSEFQKVDVLDSIEFGRILVLDGICMVTERDEFIYHDMLAHVPLAVNPSISRVLIIGAGDGGMVRELTRYPTIKTIDMVEIDKMVVDACLEFLPLTASNLNDPRVNIYYQDGLAFVRDCAAGAYDLIVVDSTDPFGPGEGLFTKEFYQNCCNALAADGLMVNQLGGSTYAPDIASMQRAFGRIKEVFNIARAYQADIPTYCGGNWLFGFGSKTLHPINNLREDEWKNFGLNTKYYNTKLHKAAFALPNNVLKLL
jgi:spermidine synthase